MSTPVPEYKAIAEMPIGDAQKLLNQWRHQYELKLHGLRISRVENCAVPVISALVERVERVQ